MDADELDLSRDRKFVGENDYDHVEVRIVAPDEKLREGEPAGEGVLGGAVVRSRPSGRRLPRLEEVEVADGGWGWVVCCTSCLTNGTIFGVVNTFGKLLKKMQEEFAEDTDDKSSRIALVGSLGVGLIFLLSSISSVIVDRFGIRRTAFCGSVLAFTGMLASSFVKRLELMYFTYSVLFGVGASLVYAPSLVILGHYFKRHLGLVNGIVTLGSGIFTIALPFLLDYLLYYAGLAWAFRVLSFLMALLMVYSLTWKPTFLHKRVGLDVYLSRESVGKAVSGCIVFLRKFLNFGIWRNKCFVIWVICLPLSLFGYFIPFYYFEQFLKEHFGDERAQGMSSVLIMCLGGASAVSRLACGKLSDFSRVNRVSLQQVSFVVMGVATTLLPVVKHFPGMVCLALLMGICDGCFICLIGPIAFDLCGPYGASQAVGFLFGLISIPMTTGPPIAGLLHDRLGSYDLAFYMAGAPPLIGAIFMFFIRNKKQHFPPVGEAESAKIMTSQNLEAIAAEYERGYVDPEGIWQKQTTGSSSTVNSQVQNAALRAVGREEDSHVRRHLIEPSPPPQLSQQPPQQQEAPHVNGNVRNSAERVTECESAI